VQVLVAEALLVLEKEVVHFPEPALGAGGLRRLRR
jgi:hypothetical protein